MAIRVKAAENAKELADVYKLRHQVYVEGEGYFKDHPGDHIVDQLIPCLKSSMSSLIKVISL